MPSSYSVEGSALVIHPQRGTRTLSINGKVQSILTRGRILPSGRRIYVLDTGKMRRNTVSGMARALRANVMDGSIHFDTIPCKQSLAKGYQLNFKTGRMHRLTKERAP